MLEDFKLKVFMAVCEEQSFTRAARKLGISQPAVSQNVAELEKELGRELFSRSGGKVSLTSDGAVFKEYVSRVLYWYSAADNLFGGRERSAPRKVRIMADEMCVSGVIPSLIPKIFSAFPGIVTEIVPAGSPGGFDIFIRCERNDGTLSIEDSSALIGSVHAACVTSNTAFIGRGDIWNLPEKVCLAVWSRYSSMLPTGFLHRTSLVSYSPDSILKFVASSPDTLGILPLDAAKNSGLALLPVDLSSLELDLMISPADGFAGDPFYYFFKNLLVEQYCL